MSDGPIETVRVEFGRETRLEFHGSTLASIETKALSTKDNLKYLMDCS